MRVIATVVYVDILLFVNTVVNYIILITAERLLKLKARTWRVILASFIGSLFALTVFIDARSFLISLLIKIVSTLTISAAAFAFHSFKELCKHSLLTLCVSFVFSGMMTAVYMVFKPPNMLIINDIVYFEFDPLVLLALTAVIYATVYFIERLFRERIRHSVVRLEFTVNGDKYDCLGKIDTGCSLTEPFSGAPVAVTDSSVFTVDDRLVRRVIPYSTVGASSLMYAVKADEVIINGKAIGKTVYIAQGRISSSAYKAVINPDIIR